MHSPRSSGYIREVDGLRALAVLSVMLFHLKASFLPGGFTGVDVFFVISGYVVTKSIAERSHNGFFSYLLEFYARRIVRIVPALVVCLVVTTVLTVLFIPQSWLSSSVSLTGLAAFFGLSNFALVRTNDGYFSPRIEFNPFVHTWSLGVEEQFYLIFPILFYAWLMWRNQTGWRGLVASSVLPMAAIVSLAFAIWLGRHKPDWAFYLLPSRFWELAAGAMLYQMHASNRFLPRSQGEAFAGLSAGLAFVLAGMFLADPAGFPFPYAVLPVIGTVLMINAVAARQWNLSPMHAAFGSAASVYIGKISYSLYLWHWPIYTLLRWTIGLETLPMMLLAVGLTFLAAVFSYHLVENSFRKSRLVATTGNKWKVAGGLAGIVLLFGASLVLYDQRQALTFSVTKQRAVWYPDPIPKKAEKAEVGRSSELSGRTIFAVGNSHTFAYTTLFDETQNKLGAKVRQIVIMTCNVANLLHRTGPSPHCRSQIENVVRSLKRDAKPGDIVFFASLRTHRLSNQWQRFDETEVLAQSQAPKAERERYLALHEAKALISKIESMGLTVLIDAPKPVYKAPPFRCADWFNKANPVCAGGFSIERAYLEQLRAPVMRSLADLKKAHTNVVVWDPFPDLCPGKVCSAFDSDGQPLYHDGDHLSGYGNRVLFPSFARQLRSIWKAGLS